MNSFRLQTPIDGYPRRKSDDQLFLAKPGASSQTLTGSALSSRSRFSSLLERSDSLDSSTSDHGASRRSAGFAVYVSATTTNATFATAFCGVDSDTTDISIRMNGPTPAGFNLLLPSCLQNNQIIKGITSLAPLRIVDFSYLPSASLISLDLTSSILLPATSSSYGFNSSTGALDWVSIFTRFSKVFNLRFAGATTAIGTTLPTILPAAVLNSFECSNCGLTGTIPNTLFEQVAGTSFAGFTFRVPFNQLIGTIPETFSDPFASMSFSEDVFLNFGHNLLTGTVAPNTFLFSNVKADVFELNFESNFLVGSFPTLPSSTFINYNRFYFAENLFNGTIPVSLTSLMPQCSLILDVSGNQLSGTLPATLFPSPYAWNGTSLECVGLKIDFSRNLLTGSIPPGLLANVWKSRILFTELISLSLASNRLTGTIPQYLFRYTSATGPSTLATIALDLSNNRLKGSIPSLLLQSMIDPSGDPSVYLNFSNNGLSSEFPPSLLSDVPTNGTGLVFLNASNNLLSGAPPALCWNTTSISMDFSNNNLTGTIPSEWASHCSLTDVNVSNNSFMMGSIPPALFMVNSAMNSFLASRTSLRGNMVLVPTNSPRILDLSYTLINFCSSSAITAFASYQGNCTFMCTSAPTCGGAYPKCDKRCIPDPIAPPIEEPQIVPSSPPPAPVPIPGCSSNTRPTPEFLCVNGVWVAPATNVTTIVIPQGAGNVIVTGNVTSTAIVINGLGATITIEGCATNLTNVVIEIDAKELAKLGAKVFQDLVSLSNCTDISNITITSNVKGSTCRKLSTEKVLTGNTLSAAFTIDSSGCNKHWIVAVSVVCAIVAVGLIAVAVAIVLIRRHQEKKAFESLHRTQS